MMEFLSKYPWIIILAAVWTLPWKGIALWKAANLRSKIWFVILLLVNTLGILEILYIFIFSKISRGENNNSSNNSLLIDNKKLNKMKMGL